jgi:hypothetical protein
VGGVITIYDKSISTNSISYLHVFRAISNSAAPSFFTSSTLLQVMSLAFFTESAADFNLEAKTDFSSNRASHLAMV